MVCVDPGEMKLGTAVKDMYHWICGSARDKKVIQDVGSRGPYDFICSDMVRKLQNLAQMCL